MWDESGGYFNQLDSRWIDEKLGFSDSSTIGDYGCGVAALAMVYKHYGLPTNPSLLNGDLKRTGALFGDLLEWPNTTAASGGRLASVGSASLFERGRADWNLINSQLDTGNPVIVYIDRPGQISHYVVLTARRGSGYLMHDPIEGPNLRFEDYYQTDWVYQTITYKRS
ncbi:MAG: C39 family peptidase [Hymenobacter sp.]